MLPKSYLRCYEHDIPSATFRTRFYYVQYLDSYYSSRNIHTYKVIHTYVYIHAELVCNEVTLLE